MGRNHWGWGWVGCPFQTVFSRDLCSRHVKNTGFFRERVKLYFKSESIFADDNDSNVVRISELFVEKGEKILETSIFSPFSTNVFSTLSQTSPGIYVSTVKVFRKTLWEEEKLLVTSNFSFSQNDFYPFEELSDSIIIFEIVVCKLFHFERI